MRYRKVLKGACGELWALESAVDVLGAQGFDEAADEIRKNAVSISKLASV